jgi:hypothetical protein
MLDFIISYFINAKKIIISAILSASYGYLGYTIITLNNRVDNLKDKVTLLKNDIFKCESNIVQKDIDCIIKTIEAESNYKRIENEEINDSGSNIAYF